MSQSVSISPFTEDLTIDFTPLKVMPFLVTPTVAALVTFHRKLS